MIVNFNIGLLGHVDAGKTTLARALSSVAGTAAFDKHPQSQERGITLDLGFSALQVVAPTHIKQTVPALEKLQITFVDCPGHASLIRTVIGGAQIIDLIILVVDAQKGIQTQTAECIVIGELLGKKLIVAINKVDLLDDATSEVLLSKLHTKIRKTLERTKFGGDVPIFDIAAANGGNIQELLNGIISQVYLPTRNIDAPLIMYVDHCFPIKGQGTVCTGTIVQGKVSVNDVVEIPWIKQQRKVKSIQMFRCSKQSAAMGDRLGLCVTQFDAKQLERGVLTQPGLLQPIYAVCLLLQRIQYYKFSIKSKSKFHVSVGHDTVMAEITVFRPVDAESPETFNPTTEYEFVEELRSDEKCTSIFALLEFEKPILAAKNCTIIGSKLDMDVNSNCCRLAFWGHMQWVTHNNNFKQEQLVNFKVFKRKSKQGTVQRLVGDRQVIVQNLFKKEGNRDIFVGKAVELSTGEVGIIESSFGTTSKVKIDFPNGIKDDTLNSLRSPRSNEVLVLLKFKKYIFNKNFKLSQ